MKPRLGSLAALGSVLLVGVALGCAKPQPKPPEFPLSLGSQVNLVQGSQGLSVLPRGKAPDWAAGLPASQAPRVAAVAASPDGYILGALNRYGLGRLDLSPEYSAFKVVNLGRMEFAGRSVSALWPRKDGFLLELYRDPFVSPSLPRSDQDPELVSVGPQGDTRVLGRLGQPGEDLFALFPGPKGQWLAEFRQEKTLGAKLRYAAYTDLETGKDGRAPSGKELKRDIFEASLAPRPLTGAPAALRSAVEALGPGPWLVHARGADGQDGYWIRGGQAEEVPEAWAWIGPGEECAVVTAPGGKAAWAKADGRRASLTLGLPVQGAEFGPCAGVFGAQGGVLAVAWSQGLFPLVSSSGLSVVALPPLTP